MSIAGFVVVGAEARATRRYPPLCGCVEFWQLQIWDDR